MAGLPEPLKGGLHQTRDFQVLMVHELTHVCQSHHSAWTPLFIFRSALAQARHGKRAYYYALGRAWHEYNVEQQAGILED